MQTQTAGHHALPLTEATFCILLSLAAGPRHGYLIMQDIETLSAGRVRLSTGTLYGAIKRLLDHGWIRPAVPTAVSVNTREVRTYELTELGRQIFRAEQERMSALVRVAQSRLVEGAL